ncbi:MAG: hypothetical protein BIFFINMI_03360 [Phycisphaerae bacterium]|nr:hypothetical protein [Phycisphaerae bacterium]
MTSERSRSSVRFVGVLGALLLSAAPAGADVIVTTPSGATVADGPVNARVTFTFTTDHVTVFLENLQADPTSVGQNLSSLLFTIDSGQTSGTLVSGNGVARSVASNKTYSDGGTVAAGWVFSTPGGAFFLNVLEGPGHAGPAHLIIGAPAGDDKYDSANGSIKGNGPHNPFLALNATFEFDVPGVTAESGISGLTFGFGTTPGANTITPPPNVGTFVPEPATLAMLALGSTALAAGRLRRGRVSRAA